MKIVFIIGVLVTFLVAIVTGTLISEYKKMKVFDELATCNATWFFDIISESPALSQIDCGIKCSEHPDCRRLMFDRKTKQCSMFESGANCIADQNVQDKVCYRQKYVCGDVSCQRCPIGYYGGRCQNIIQDCTDGYVRDVTPNKPLLSYIQPKTDGPIVEVKCDFMFGGQTFIQSRYAACNEIDFNRTWDEYANGFGNIHGDYWLGLEHVYNMLQNHPRFALRVLLEPDTGNRYCSYVDFNILSSDHDYAISLGTYTDVSVTMGNSLTSAGYNISGRPFSTYDRDKSNNDCPNRFNGGWWYLDNPVCSRANVNGRRVDDQFEGMQHWQDNMGNITDFEVIMVKLLRI